jgi:hypothetical protein
MTAALWTAKGRAVAMGGGRASALLGCRGCLGALRPAFLMMAVVLLSSGCELSHVVEAMSRMSCSIRSHVVVSLDS